MRPITPAAAIDADPPSRPSYSPPPTHYPTARPHTSFPRRFLVVGPMKKVKDEIKDDTESFAIRTSDGKNKRISLEDFAAACKED